MYGWGAAGSSWSCLGETQVLQQMTMIHVYDSMSISKRCPETKPIAELKTLPAKYFGQGRYTRPRPRDH